MTRRAALLRCTSVDWEHPQGREQAAQYLELLRTVRRYLPSPRYILTSALPAGEWALRDLDLGKVQDCLDYINVMAYDFSGPWLKTLGHHAQLATPAEHRGDDHRLSCQSAVDYILARGVKPSKILLGIPLYGRCFMGATEIGQHHCGYGERPTVDYRDLPGPGAKEFMDLEAGAAYCLGGAADFISYDNSATVKMKAEYAVEKGLGGLFYWSAAADKQGEDSLIATGFQTLRSGH